MASVKKGEPPAENLVGYLDRSALAWLGQTLDISLEGTLNARRDAVAAARPRARDVLDSMRREDMVAALRYVTFQWEDEYAHISGLSAATDEDLRAAIQLVIVDDWNVSKRKTSMIPGTSLGLCWGAWDQPHLVVCDDVTLDAPSASTGAFFENAIYTIVHPDRIANHEHAGFTFTEKKVWTKAAQWLARAHDEDVQLALVLGDATDVSRLIGWSHLESIDLGPVTTIRTAPIVPMRRARRSTILKASDGNPLAAGYIYPYIPCKLPAFLEATLPSCQRPVVSTAIPVPAVSPAVPKARTELASAPGASTPLAFSWGYAGWGPHTKSLVEMVDEVEAARGYGPPLFVDVRIRRQVRAPGFRDREFEELLGPDRYLWMKRLGNRAVLGEEADDGGDYNIDDPTAADDLLNEIDSSATRGRRVIFFCSCGSPLERSDCHRGEIVNLLLGAAQRRKRPLTVHEWPGGSPAIYDVEVPKGVLKRLENISRSEDNVKTRIPIREDADLATLRSIAHLSILRCHAGQESFLAASGPLVRSAKGWVLPILNGWEDEDPADLCKVMDRALKEHELLPLGDKLELPTRWRRETLRL